MSVSFSQSVYIVNENDGLVQAKLFLNTSLATDITIQVRANDGTATGECIYQIHNNMLSLVILQEVLIIILDHTMLYFLLE